MQYGAVEPPRQCGLLVEAAEKLARALWYWTLERRILTRHCEEAVGRRGNPWLT